MQHDLNNIIFPRTLSVTEQVIDISILNEQQRRFYIGLFNKLTNIYRTKGKQRMIIGVSGPSGSGKSVVAILFKEIAKQVKLPFTVEAISIDAFHYPNIFLDVMADDKGDTLKMHKGRFDTYDTAKLARKLDSFVHGEPVTFPLYSRAIHDPIEDSITITAPGTLLIVEGLWLLHRKAGWEEIAGFFDYNIFITGNKEKAKELVVKRHMKGGRTTEDAITHFNKVDSVNFDLIMESSVNADMIIPPFYEIG